MFLKPVFIDLKGCDEEKEKLIDEVFTLIGNRLLDLHEFVALVAECKSVKSPESVRAAAYMYAVKKKYSASVLLTSLLLLFQGTSTSSIKCSEI